MKRSGFTSGYETRFKRTLKLYDGDMSKDQSEKMLETFMKYVDKFIRKFIAPPESTRKNFTSYTFAALKISQELGFNNLSAFYERIIYKKFLKGYKTFWDVLKPDEDLLEE